MRLVVNLSYVTTNAVCFTVPVKVRAVGLRRAPYLNIVLFALEKMSRIIFCEATTGLVSKADTTSDRIVFLIMVAN